MNDLTPLQIINVVLSVFAVVVTLVAFWYALRNTGGSRARTYFLFVALISLAVAQIITASASAHNIAVEHAEWLFAVRAALAGLRILATIMLLYYIFSSKSVQRV